MKHKLNLAILILLFSLAAQTANADGVLLSWSPRDVPGLTEQSFNDAKQAKVEDVLSRNLKVTSWADAYLIAVSANVHKSDKNLLSGLVSQLTDTTKVSLKDTSKLIIWERIKSGEILFEGKGVQISDDLFTVAGRANWVLRNLTSKNFGHVRPASSPEELKALQDKWTRWRNGDQVEEFKNPYPTSVKGLDEIRNREALEAMIFSLKSSSEKDKLTKDCLKRIYNTDKLPDDPNSPASLCSPERYTHGYLRVVTGITDKHDYDWWKKWWEANSNSLKWNSEKGLFEVSAPNKQ